MKPNTLTNHVIDELSKEHKTPCISLYLPTHRHHPENQQDPIRFRGLLRTIESKLEKGHSATQIKELLTPLEELAKDRDIWNHALDGLAVFAAPGCFKVVTLQRPVRELSIVADSFHFKPLRRFLQSVDRYQILGLSLHEIKLFEGNRDVMDELTPAPNVPQTITDALGEEVTTPHQTVASYGGTANAMHHGHGGKKDEADIDEVRFFRAIDRAIMEHHSQPSGLPLMLAALPEHHGEFHEISHNPALLKDGLKVNPASLTTKELRVRAWEVFEPSYRKRLAALADDYKVAQSKGLGLEDLTEIAKAAFEGRVATVLIEADREISGRIHPGSGKVHLADTDDDYGDDLLDDLGEMVAQQGGEVLVILSSLMPTKTGAAAICRF